EAGKPSASASSADYIDGALGSFAGPSGLPMWSSEPAARPPGNWEHGELLSIRTVGFGLFKSRSFASHSVSRRIHHDFPFSTCYFSQSRGFMECLKSTSLQWVWRRFSEVP